MSTLQTLIQQITNGLVLGSLYALVALGYTMVYGLLQLFNFAHGDLFMCGAYAAFVVLAGISAATIGPALALIAVILLAFLASGVAAGALGLATERFAVPAHRQRSSNGRSHQRPGGVHRP